MSSEFKPIFVRLRDILRRHAGRLDVKEDSETCYCLEGNVGPAMLKVWKGKMKKPAIPVGWVEIGKAYVSYHLMAIYGNDKLLDGMSQELKARMQGKTCFNFKQEDEALFQELEHLTVRGFDCFKKAGFVADS
jgi:hypothetical protein